MSETSTSTPSAISALNQEVAEAIKGSGELIRGTVKAKFVQDEVNRRTNLLTNLIVAINAFRKEGYKIKPDLISFNADKSPATELWSKAQLEKKTKFEEKLAKAESTFEKALNNNEYDKVEEVINQLKPEAKTSDKATGKTYEEGEVSNVK